MTSPHPEDSGKEVSQTRLGRGLLTVSGLTFISRILGLIRDMVIASMFALGTFTDAFFVAFKIPNVLRRLTAEGAFTQAFVPEFNFLRKKEGEVAAAALRDQACAWLALGLSGIVLLGVIVAPVLVLVLAPGFAETTGKQAAATDMLRIVFPYLLLISLTAFGGALLNSFGRFAAFAFAPALLNICMIGAALWLAPLLTQPVYALALGVVAGGFAQMLVVFFGLQRIGQMPKAVRPKLAPGVRRILLRTGQGTLGVAAAQLSIAISLVFASFLEEGSVSWLYFADRLMELPAGMIGAALATVALPTLARCSAAEDQAGFTAALDWGMRTAMFLAVPAAVALALLAEPLCATLFQRGEFSAADTDETAKAVIAYAVGVPALASVRLLAAGFTSRLDVMTPVKISIVALIVAVGLYAALTPHLAHAGLALAVSISASLNAVLLLIIHIRRASYRPQPGWLGVLLRIATACLVMGLVLRIYADKSQWTLASEFDRIWRLALTISAGAASYFLVLRLSGVRLAQIFEFRAKDSSR